MRACLLVLVAVAFVSPAHARSHSSHHAAYRHHPHHRVARVHIREAPIISGYAMPQSFARTDAADSPATQQAWQAPTASPVIEARHRRLAPVRDGALDGMIARHAAANGVPVELVRRVVARESGGDARARNGGALGLMQIKHATARGMGYSGSAFGLFDAETNLTYAVRYLAGAYRAAGGNANRAVAYYASGYYGRGAVARRAPMADAAPWQMQSSAVAMPSEAIVLRKHRHRRHKR